MKHHHKKILALYYEAILAGTKTFELRLANWECAPGDVLVLEEWDEEGQAPTGRVMERGVSYVLRTRDCGFWSEEEVAQHGYQILGLEGAVPARYQHYKGGIYTLLTEAMHTETGEELVIYQAVEAPRKVWARPKHMWSDMVGDSPRFTLL